MERKSQRSMNEAGAAISAANDQVRAVQDVLKTVSHPPSAVSSAVDALTKRLAELTRQLSGGGRFPGGGRGEGGEDQPVRTVIAGVKSQIMTSTSLPTAQQARAATDAVQQLSKLIADLNDVKATALPALYKLLSDNKINVPTKP